MICYICEKEIGKGQFGIHLKKCKREHDLRETIEEIKFKQLVFHYNIQFNNEFFEKEYLENKKSILEISKEFNFGYDHVSFFLQYFGISKRTLKEECNNERVRNKCKNTCREKYGSENPSGAEIIKEKKRNTFIKNYGVDNIFKDENFKTWLITNNFAWNSKTEEENKNRVEKQIISIRKFWNESEKVNKIKEDNKQKIKKFISSMTDEERKIYNKKKGAWWHKLNDEQKTAFLNKRFQNSSKLETKIAEILITLNIGYTTQKFISKTSYDFLLNNTKILIEVQGDFWHGNPEIYKENDILQHPMNHILAKNQWKKDEEKRINAEKYGYKVIYIWEKEINGKKDNELIELLIKKLQL